MDVTVENLKEALEKQAVVAIDVREEGEFVQAHVPGVRNIPLSILSCSLDSLPKDRELFVMCLRGGRSQQAVRLLRQAGFEKARNVAGGFSAWLEAAYPVQRTSRGLPVLRQAQLAIGVLLIFSGLFGWDGLVVLIGIGLAAAGWTGRCLAAELISRMPWNKSSSAL